MYAFVSLRLLHMTIRDDSFVLCGNETDACTSRVLNGLGLIEAEVLYATVGADMTE